MKKSRLVEQFDQDKERRPLGTHGAASEVRKINLASSRKGLALLGRLGHFMHASGTRP
jgi:hypothetical protein